MRKAIMRSALAVVFNCILGATFAVLLGIHPAVGAVALNAVALLVGDSLPQGPCARAC